MYRLIETLICLIFWVALLASVLLWIAISRLLESDLPLLGIPVSFFGIVYGYVILEDRVPKIILEFERIRRRIIQRGR